VFITVGTRRYALANMRRKPASVLMFLVTRSEFSANREQVIDALWPDSDPDSAANNLNQSLYFLRRDIDPWYEDDVSVDYVGFQGDVVWLDAGLIHVKSVEFVRGVKNTPADSDLMLPLLTSYTATFAPEFEYEEWAMAWRARVHSTFLEMANTSVSRLVARGDLPQAKAIAAHTLTVDPDASDVERRLVWLYARLRLESAARSQYEHLAGRERAEGGEPQSYSDLVHGDLPE
jgi:LuxR family maltose regulon positive regulatory protein